MALWRPRAVEHAVDRSECERRSTKPRVPKYDSKKKAIEALEACKHGARLQECGNYLKGRGIAIEPANVRLLDLQATRKLFNVNGRAMVAGIRRKDQAPAVHVTFLDPDGTKKHPDVDPVRKMFGPSKGGYVRLGKPDPEQPLIIGEGIETTLSAMQLAGVPGIAALDAGNMKVIVPPKASRYIVAGDNDENGVGQEAAHALAERLREKGKDVSVAIPEDEGTDWNDGLQRCKGSKDRKALRKRLLQGQEGGGGEGGEGAFPQDGEISDASSHDDGLSPEDAEEIARLASLNHLDYDRQEKDAAKKLGIRRETLRAVVKKERARNAEDEALAEHSKFMVPVDPWPEEIDGKKLMDGIVACYKRYVITGKHEYVAAALWVVHAHAHDAFQHSPLLEITAPTPESGKTNTASVTKFLTPRPLKASNMTPATLFRAVELWRPTLVIDEADTFIKDKPELRGMLDDGHKRDGCVLRCVEVNNQLVPKPFSVWAPKAIALIGRLHPTLESRAIIIKLRRKFSATHVDRLIDPRPEDENNEFNILRRKCARWAIDNVEMLRNARPELPKALGDRAKDNWEPLLAIADLCGYSRRARKAAVRLSKRASREEIFPIQLLRDIRHVFETEYTKPEITTDNLVCHLEAMEGRPWAEYRHGKPITASSIAKMLKPFGIEPHKIKKNGKENRGYNVEQFKDVFRRYLQQ